MAQLIVRNLDDAVKDGLRHMAGRHGHSMEEEVRAILSAAIACHRDEAPKKLGSWIANLFEGKGLDMPVLEMRGRNMQPAEFE